jgi:TusA-related sulfurtransferase
MTWVKTRIALGRIAAGERLELWLRAGEPVESVPRSAAAEGHRILSVEAHAAEAGVFRVTLEKVEARVAAPGEVP